MEVDETLRRIQSQKGVTGIIIMDNFGRSIRSTLDDETTRKHSALLKQLCDQSKSVTKEIDATNDLAFLRLKTSKNEIMVAPDKDFLVAVIYEKSS
uniref:Dynein light chain roadblock n=1 Tax=Panagrolaimus sp. ES5 TaxID=591445 RepID=A0AC34G272_9BILA